MEFDLGTCIKNAWSEVSELYRKGLIPNENPCNFCLCRAIWDQLPKGVQLTYDNVASDRPRIVPDLIIWTNTEEPAVLFIGEMIFWPHYGGTLSDVEADLKNLSLMLNSDEIHTLTLEPSTGEYDYRPVKIADSTQAGFFITARHDSPHVAPDNIRKMFDQEKVDRLHICTGKVFGDDSTRSVFKYIKPDG